VLCKYGHTTVSDFFRVTAIRILSPTARNVRRSQPVGATPSDMNSISKGGVYGTRKTEQAFH
jgi:hypothetical protein